MSEIKNPSELAGQLRRRAEERLPKNSAQRPPPTEPEAQRLLHELEVHQIELEMQNAELRAAWEEAELLRERYADLYDFAPVGYFTLDRQGIIRAANLAGATALGLDRSRLLGRNFLSFVADPDRQSFAAFLMGISAGRGKQALEIELFSELHPPTFLHIEAAPDSSGQECRIATLDVTERRAAEAELQQYRTHLEGLVRERTADLEDEIDQRKRAQQAITELNNHLEQLVAERTGELQATVRDLQAFSYSVSHDLRSPLRSINSFANLLLEEFGAALNQAGRDVLGSIVMRTVSMGQLIDDLLLFSRNSMQQLTLKPIDMTELAQRLVAKLAAEGRGVDVEFRIADLPQAMGDQPMIAQVLENLLSNAVKFSGKVAKPVVEVGSLPDEKENVYFVRDNGVGFDMKYVHNIFGVFQRLHSTEEFEGTGVGLAIVEQIVTKHGGRAWAEGRPGEGATLYFSLPKP